MNAPQPSSRKGFLAGAALGAGALLSGCGDDTEPAANRGAGARDVATLNNALALEHLSVALYSAGLALVRGRQRDTVEALLGQERDHVRGLTEAIRDLGGAASKPLPASAYRKQLGIDGMRGQAFLRLATRVENHALASYLERLPVLSDGRLRQTAAAIMANKAEHLAVLTGMRDPGRPVRQAPAAFVSGS